MNWRGTTPPTTLSTNSKPSLPGMGSTSMWQMANSPWPPLCLTFRPSPLALPPTVSRSGTRSALVSTATPYRLDSRSSSTSAWASPMHHSTGCWVSALLSRRSVGAAAPPAVRVGLPHAPQPLLMALGVVLPAQRRVLGHQAAHGLGHLVLVRLG